MARAESMDLALSRLRRAPGTAGCPVATEGGEYCADIELYERLVGELARAMAPGFNTLASTVGPRGYALSLSTVWTPIKSSALYWRRGTEGSGSQREGDVKNDAPADVLVVERLEVRKGLPFGFEVAANAGPLFGTSAWALGAELKLALFEGYHTGWGMLPDVAIRAGAQRSVGVRDLALTLLHADLLLSKTFRLAAPWSIAPELGWSVSSTRIVPDLVDLTPGVPFSAIDARNNVYFPTLNQRFVRMFFGVEARYDVVFVSTAIALDLSVPTVQARPLVHSADPEVARLVSGTVTVGLRY